MQCLKEYNRIPLSPVPGSTEAHFAELSIQVLKNTRKGMFS